MLKNLRSIRDIKPILLIFTLSIFSSLLIVFYFNYFPPKNLEVGVPHGSNEVVERNFDGPLYIVIAKTFYNPSQLKDINFNSLKPIYYANHFPLYPILIRLLTFITNNYFRSMILLTWLISAFYSIMFYLFLKKFNLSKNPLSLTLISLFIPARWLALRTVGGVEPIFLFILLFILWFYFEKKYLISSMFGFLLVLVKPHGIRSFIGILLAILLRNRKKILNNPKLLAKYGIYLLMPLGLFLLFVFYKYTFNDFWAYFHAGLSAISLFKLVPFGSILDNISIRSEGYFYFFTIIFYGIYKLWKNYNKDLAIICFIFLLPHLFLQHADIYRYLIPIAPFTLIIAYQNIYKHRLFKIFFFAYLIGVYAYTLNLLPQNMSHYWDYANLRILTTN